MKKTPAVGLNTTRFPGSWPKAPTKKGYQGTAHSYAPERSKNAAPKSNHPYDHTGRASHRAPKSNHPYNKKGAC